MNWDIIEGKWKQLRGDIQSEWGRLTGDEIDQVEGDRGRFVGLVQERYGIAKADAEAQIDKFFGNLGSRV